MLYTLLVGITFSAVAADPENPTTIRRAGGQYELFVIGLNPRTPGVTAGDDRTDGMGFSTLITKSCGGRPL